MHYSCTFTPQNFCTLCTLCKYTSQVPTDHVWVWQPHTSGTYWTIVNLELKSKNNRTVLNLCINLLKCPTHPFFQW